MAQKINPSPRCVFCGQGPASTSHMLVCGDKYLCGDCFLECKKLIENDTTATVQKTLKWTPESIVAALNRRIVGQTTAKKQLAVAVYHHLKRIADPSNAFGKSNILIVGPTGSGKTLFAKTLSDLFDVPIIITDATKYTKVGYVGADVEQMLSRLVEAANGDVAKAQRGIIYIDEIDKIRRKSNSTSVSVDPSGEGVQHSLLKLMEGTETKIKISDGPYVKTCTFDTSNILFICAGAFEGIMDKKDNQLKKHIGFTTSSISQENVTQTGELVSSVTVEDLTDYGIAPELLGRLPVIVTLEDLTEDELMQILTEPEGAITKDYIAFMESDGIELSFSNDALREIAKKAIQRKTGARGLRSILEHDLMEMMYEAPSFPNIKKYEVTAEDIKNGFQGFQEASSFCTASVQT